MDAKKVLIIQTAFIGDALLTVPLLKRMGVAFQGSEITFLCRKGLGDIFLKLKLVNSVIEFDKSDTSQWDDIQQRLKNQSFDIVFSPHQSFRSEMLVKNLSAKTKVGYSKWWNFFIFNKRISRPMMLPEALRLLALLEPFDEEVKTFFSEIRSNKKFVNSQEQGTVNFTRDDKIPDLASAHIKSLALPQEEVAIDKLIKDLNLQTYRLILMAPGSVWATKKWTSDGFVQLGKTLQEGGYQIAIIGSKNESEDCSNVASHLVNSVNLCGKTTLTESLELMKRSAMLVSNDSGAAHLASLVGLKTISIFGPTVLDLGYRPWNNLNIVNQIPLKCRPCGKHGSDKCPIDTHECMKGVLPTNVLVNAEKLLNKL